MKKVVIKIAIAAALILGATAAVMSMPPVKDAAACEIDVDYCVSRLNS